MRQKTLLKLQATQIFPFPALFYYSSSLGWCLLSLVIISIEKRKIANVCYSNKEGWKKGEGYYLDITIFIKILNKLIKDSKK